MISTTFRITSPHAIPLCLIMHVMLEVSQGFSLYDGLIYGPNTPSFQHRLRPIFNLRIKVEQNVFVPHVRNLKSEFNEFLHVCPNISCFFKFYEFVSGLLDDAVREKVLLYNFLKLCPSVYSAQPFPYLFFLMPLP